MKKPNTLLRIIDKDSSNNFTLALLLCESLIQDMYYS